jgi:ribosomal-protein-alanine N-acetyltransferase
VASAAVARLARLAFGELGLHRIEAGTLVHNLGSQRVLQRNGFQRYGLAPRFLKIAGQWRDHVLFQLLADDGQ